MKRNLRTRSVAVLGAAISAASLCLVHGQENCFYWEANTGGQVTQDTPLQQFFGEPLAPGAKIVFDPGFRFGFLAGYRICDWFATEIESGFMANNIKSITGANQVHNATYSNTPFMINARIQGPARWWVAPYCGGGFGGSVAMINADEIDLGTTTLDGWMSGAAFAYQAFGGIRCKINERMGISLQYNYFATTDTTFHADFTVNTPSDRMRVGGTQTHAASVVFDMTF